SLSRTISGADRSSPASYTDAIPARAGSLVADGSRPAQTAGPSGDRPTRRWSIRSFIDRMSGRDGAPNAIAEPRDYQPLVLRDPIKQLAPPQSAAARAAGEPRP